MTVPQYPDKHEASALITPDRGDESDDENDRLLRSPDLPSAVVLTFQPELFEHVVAERVAEQIDDVGGLFSLYRLGDHPDVGVAGDFGIGAPITAMVAEQLAAGGVERFCIAGIAGCLQREVGMGEPVVCTRALRDEGVSHHYVEPGRWATADEAMVQRCETAVEEADLPVHRGPTWTTSAVYRETIPEIERYADEGILTVDMEAAALFAVAEYRDVEAGALFTVSDYLGPDEWDPRFDATDDHLQNLFDVAVSALS
ncbi:MAG TPA: nucleoside phosphorylase [Natrialbaceae archaeon]|nr:nucleoside phosphorylase [Natrialbaceae archaeon]